MLRPLTAGLQAPWIPVPSALHDLARHADSGVRGWAVFGLRYGVDAGRRDALAAVLACTRDEAAEVRRGPAPRWSPRPRIPRSRTLRRASPTRRRTYRVTAAVQLALRDDPRGDEILAALTPPMRRGRTWAVLDVERHRRKTDAAAPR